MNHRKDLHLPLGLKNTKLKVGWKSVCTLLCTIALTLECINVTLNAHCNNNTNKNNSTTYLSLLQQIPKVLPTSNDTSVSRDMCSERREFPLKASNKRINVCTYQDRVRVDVREFINDKATIKGTYFTSREFISVSDALPYVRHEILRQMEILRNAMQIYITTCKLRWSFIYAVDMSRTLRKELPAIKLCGEETRLQKRKKMINACCDDSFARAVGECCWNVTNGRVRLSPHKIRQLKRHKALMRKLSDRSVPVSQKRKVIQTGSGLLLYCRCCYRPDTDWRI